MASNASAAGVTVPAVGSDDLGAMEGGAKVYVVVVGTSSAKGFFIDEVSAISTRQGQAEELAYQAAPEWDDDMTIAVLEVPRGTLLKSGLSGCPSTLTVSGGIESIPASHAGVACPPDSTIVRIMSQEACDAWGRACATQYVEARDSVDFIAVRLVDLIRSVDEVEERWSSSVFDTKTARDLFGYAFEHFNHRWERSASWEGGRRCLCIGGLNPDPCVSGILGLDLGETRYDYDAVRNFLLYLDNYDPDGIRKKLGLTDPETRKGMCVCGAARQLTSEQIRELLVSPVAHFKGTILCV
jgi:hypothetical protein